MFLERFGEGRAGRVVPVVDEHLRRAAPGEAEHPVQQAVFVSVPAHAGQIGDLGPDGDVLAVGAGAEILHQRGHVLRVIERLGRLAARALGLARFILGLAHLDVRRVAQHNVRQRTGGGGGVNGPGKAVLGQQRQQARVVDVRVREQGEVHFAGGDGQALVDEHVLPLLHAAVHDEARAAALDERAAARHLMRRAEECYFHVAPFPRWADVRKSSAISMTYFSSGRRSGRQAITA